MLKITLKGCSPRVKELAYTTVCRPILEYASSVWSPYRKRDINKLEMVQRKAYRWIYSLKKDTHITERMTDHNWETLADRRINKDLSTLTKAVNGMLVLDVDDQVDWNKSHNTRDGRIVRRFNTNAKKYSFYNRTFKATVTVQKTQM